MSGPPVLRICALYPEQLNLYADRGNLLVLAYRCRSRGIGVRVDAVTIGDSLDPDGHDIFFLGGGQDRDQARCAEDLVRTKRDALAEAAERGAPVLGICGGYQLLGHAYETPRETLPGVGLVDVRTVRSDADRLVGHAVVEVDLGAGPRMLVGFENHAGRTELGPAARPLGHVVAGHGNNGRDGTEGARRGSVIGTYLHGPLLPGNPWFADWLIGAALGLPDLEGVDDELELSVHRRNLDLARAGGSPSR